MIKDITFEAIQIPKHPSCMESIRDDRRMGTLISVPRSAVKEVRVKQHKLSQVALHQSNLILNPKQI